FAVRREEGAPVVATRCPRKLADILAVRIHDVQFQISVAIGTKDDLLAIGRITAFGIVAFRRCEGLETGPVWISFEDIHAGVEVPLVRPPLPGLVVFFTLPIFLLLMLFGIWIKVAAREDDFLAVWTKVRARGLADSGTDPSVSPSLQV